VDKKLSRDDIKTWLKAQGQVKYLMEKEALTENDLDHIATCMHDIYLAYHDEVPASGLGHFLTAVIKNDLVGACVNADSTNRLVLPLYVIFLHNCAPGDYKQKLGGGFQ